MTKEAEEFLRESKDKKNFVVPVQRYQSIVSVIDEWCTELEKDAAVEELKKVWEG